MLKNYLQVAVRNLMRNKVFSALNVAGLAIGLSACFLIWQYVRFESGYDQFHSNAGRLYRVPYYVEKDSAVVGGVAVNVPAVAPNMKAEFPEVEDFCRLVKTSLFTSEISKYVANALELSHEKSNGQLVVFNEESVWFADPPFMTMFSFPILEGNDQALKEPRSIVLTKKVAKKFFGEESAIGKQLRLNRDMLLTVTAVLDDVPENSHLQFDVLISFSTIFERWSDGYSTWGWQAFYNYVLLVPGADPKEVEAKLPAFQKKHLGKSNEGEYTMRYFLQPVTDIHLYSDLGGEQSRNSNERTIYFLSILAVFILVVAWINYINLSTAKALERSKEVGLRKTVGASRVQLIVQFLFDAAVINVLAVLLSILILIVSWEPFESLVGKNMLNVLLNDDMRDQFLFIGVVLAGGIMLAGVYPAINLSSFKPAEVLKGKYFRSNSGARLRKIMISFQYVLAVLLLAGTITIYLQLNYMRSRNPGFAKEQIVVIEAPAVYDENAENNIARFKQMAAQASGVSNITASADVPGKMSVENAPVIRNTASPTDQYFDASVPAIDTSFFNTYGIRLLHGRLFNATEKMKFRRNGEPEAIPVIVNEEFVRNLQVSDLENALGEKVRFWWGPEERVAQIVGVVTNHHQVSFKESIRPFMYMQPQWTGYKYFSVRLSGKDIQSSLQGLESAYAKAFPDNPFTHFFLDEYFDRQYQDDRQFGKIFNVFTILAVVVTCFGLLGLSIFSASQRTKEVGIRKVLGAPVSSLVFLFSKGFVSILLISYILAVPVIYLAGESWLKNFPFRIALRWEIFALPPLLLVLVTMLTIGLISLKAAFENPVRALRQD
jgi:putative ABC transport system permease protein